MDESSIPWFRHRSGRLIALLVIVGLATGCVGAASTPDSSQAPSGRSPAPAWSDDASRLGSASPVNGNVPWLDRQAAAFVEATPQPHPTDARPCRAADLRARAGEPGAGLGNTNLPVDFLNSSGSTCLLKGEPTIGGLRADATLVPLPVSEGSYFGDPGPTANIAPGGTAALNISGADACPAALSGKHRVYPNLRIGLPDGGSIDVAARGFDTVCGVSVSRFGVPADAEPATDPPLSPLTAEIRAPTTAVAGHSLAYTVTLTNPSGRDVLLNPCPAYDEFVGSGSTTVWVETVRHFYLNCNVATTIPAGGSVTFDMRLTLPADQPGGMAKFSWDLQGGGGPWANALLEVLPGGG